MDLIPLRKFLKRDIWRGFFLPAILVLLLRVPIIELLNTTLVKYVFAYIHSSIINDLLFAGISAYILLLSVSKLKDYTISKKIIYILITSAGVYLYFRLTNTVWKFTSFKFDARFKYADVIVLFVGLSILVKINTSINKKVTETSGDGFFDDMPLGAEKKDEFGFESYIATITEKILHSKSKNSIAMGINGQWGSGKTSFLDLIKRGLKDKDVIQINFDPWNCHTPQAIIKDFFETVQSTLKIYHSNLGDLLQQYSEKLVELDDSQFFKYLKVPLAPFKNEHSLQGLYTKVDESIKKVGKKIVIFIDDLDRLDKDEIVEVIRLIRNTANFSNTVFIVAYDRNYIVNALKQHNSFNNLHFLEKIFQVEVSLPYYDAVKLRKALADKLKLLFPLHTDLIDDEVMGTGSVTPTYLIDWLETMRDVTRLANGLSLNMKSLIGEVVFSEFLKLELLRLKYPTVYELIYKKRDDFLDQDQMGNKANGYVLDTISEAEQKGLKLGPDHTRLELYLTRKAVELNLSFIDIQKAINLVSWIFHDDEDGFYPAKSHLSVVYPSKFEMYFSYSLLSGNLSEIAFTNARSADIDTFKKAIDAWLKDSNDLVFDLQSRLKLVRRYDNREDYEKMIQAIFHFARQEYQGTVIGYPNDELINRLRVAPRSVASELYKEDVQKLKTFVTDLLTDAKMPFTFEAKLIKAIIIEPNDFFPVTKAELNSIALGFLAKHVDNTNFFTVDFWKLFDASLLVAKINGSSEPVTVVTNDATDLLKSLIKKDPDAFIRQAILLDPDNKQVMLDPKVVQAFGTKVEFETFFQSMEDSEGKYVAEFKQVLAQFNHQSSEVFIQFNFRKIPSGVLRPTNNV